MFQLSLSTILTSPTTPGAGLIPALSGDFSAALAGVVDASVKLPSPDGAPPAPRQGDAETGKSLPIPAVDGATGDPALTWLDDGATLVAAGDARHSLATKQDAPAFITLTKIGNSVAGVPTPAIAIPVSVAPAVPAAPILPAESLPPPSAGADRRDVSPDDAAAMPPSPSMSETAQTELSAESSTVAAIEPDSAPAKRGDPKDTAVAAADGRHREAKHAEDAPPSPTLIGVIAGLTGTPPLAADPLPPPATAQRDRVPAQAIATTLALAAPTGDHSQTRSTSDTSAADGVARPGSAQPAASAAIVDAAKLSPGFARGAALPTVSLAPADHPTGTLRPNQAPIRSPEAAAAAIGPIVAPPASGSPQPQSSAMGIASVAPSAGTDAAPAPLTVSAPTPAALADPTDTQAPATRLTTDGAAKADAPAPPAAGLTAPPARSAPVPQPAQPAAIVLGVAFGGIMAGARPLGGERPSPREQALQALSALAGAAPAAPIAATAQAQHGALDMRRDDWPQAMIDRIEALRDAADATSTRISLVPDALGKIDLSIRHDGNNVHVHFAADAAPTRVILADAQPKLAELAQQRGFRLGQATVDAGANGGGQRQQPQTGAPTPQRPASAFTATADDAAADPTRLA